MPRKKQTRNDHTARKLRANMSLPEVLLWKELRKEKNVKFRRQHGIGRYVVDFYCASAKLCVEIDGLAHEMGDRPQRDAERDALLRSQGLEVFRISASEVLASPSDVADSLVRYCNR